MATLEVHDGRGRVEFVMISKAHPALFGSDPKCDVVLNDPAAKPFHGRLRWKGDKFKAEAFPEAKSLDLNGQKMVAASFRQGDEITVGGCRIFLVSTEDGPADLEPTRIQARPAGLDDPGWLDAGRSEPTPEAGAPTGRAIRQGTAATTAATAPAARAAEPVVAAATAPVLAVKVPWWRKALRKLNAGDRPPGQEDLTRSPLVLGLAVALGCMLLVGYGLWNIYVKNRADQQFAVANSLFEEGDYVGAMNAFDEFLVTNPGETRVGRARVLRELSDVRQFTASGGVSWTAAIANAREMIQNVGKEPYYRDRRMDLAADILKAAAGFADVARANADPKALEDARDALELHKEVADTAHKAILNNSDVPQKLAAAEAAVTKARIRRESLAKMTGAVKAAKPDVVYANRDALVRQYPDLETDEEVVGRLTEANELIRKAVTFDPTSRPAETTPQPDPLGPPVSLVLRQVPPGGTAPPASDDGPVVFANVQGYLYAIDGANGAPLWHVPVGLTSPFPPITVSGRNPSAIAFDARHDELVRFDGRTGKLLWRQALGEPITSPPLVLGNQIVQVIPSGKLVLIDLASGAIKGTLVIGRPLAGSPAADEAGQFFYLTGDRDNVYVIARDPLECVSVAYLGHPSGSVRCAPARLANFLIVPENRELWEGRWSVFVIEQQGEQLRLAQSVKIPGWTWQTPQSQGTIVWSLTDRNAITAFAVGPEDSKNPLTQVVQTVPDNRPSGPAFAHARGDRELWISSSRLGRFDLEAQLKDLTPTWTIERAGPSVGPIQMADRLAVFSHQYDEGPGVALWAVDPSEGTLVWKTVLGVPWPLPPTPSEDGSRLTTLATNGPEVTIGPELLQKGGFLEQPLRNPGYFYLPDGPLRRLEKDGLTIVVPAPDADHLLVREDRTSEFRRVDLPAPLGAPPVFWGEDLFAPGLDGRAYLVDPKTGAAEAEPYVPAFEADNPTRWRAPAFLNDAIVLADQSGVVRRLQRLTEPRLHLDVVGEPEDLKSSLEVDPAATSDAVIVVTDDGRVRSLAGRDLSPLGAWGLEIPRAFGPLAVGENVYLIDKAGGVLAFAPDGSRLWAADLRDAPPIGPPVAVGDAIWFLSRDGVLQKRSLADGSPLDRLDLGILPGGGLTALGPDVVVSAAPGTIRLLKSSEEPVEASP